MITDGVMGPVEIFPTEPTLQLQENDRVEYGGMEGTVTHVDDSELWDSHFPVTIKFDAGYEFRVTRDGRQFRHQKLGLIKVIGKVKPKVKRWQWLMKHAMNNNKWILSEGFYSEEEASEYKYLLRKIEETEIECDE